MIGEPGIKSYLLPTWDTLVMILHLEQGQSLQSLQTYPNGNVHTGLMLSALPTDNTNCFCIQGGERYQA